MSKNKMKRKAGHHEMLSRMWQERASRCLHAFDAAQFQLYADEHARTARAYRKALTKDA